VTTIKIDAKIGGNPAAAFEPHVPALYSRPGCRILVVAELAHVERTQPAPDTEGTPSVKMRISSLEIASKEQEGALREALRALYLQRTASGTLDDDGQMVLTDHTLKMTAALMTDIEVARLRAGLARWTEYARRVAGDNRLTQSEIRHELQSVADGMASTLSRAAVDTSDE
jgi:hypothetical protein